MLGVQRIDRGTAATSCRAGRRAVFGRSVGRSPDRPQHAAPAASRATAGAGAGASDARAAATATRAASAAAGSHRGSGTTGSASGASGASGRAAWRTAAGHAGANPFLQQDPSTRARRLARALVSDLVVYYPEKRRRGLAEGNLKELFGEEIRKSWEEYTEQVGEEIASNTPYFTEALNEILAEGRSLFG